MGRPEFEPPPRVFEDDYPFELGKSITIREGEDATVIAAGLMVSRALAAGDLLKKEGNRAQLST